MSNHPRNDDDAAQAGPPDGAPGDVEAAGETTAAATLGGDTTDPKPVGADTLVEVADAEGRAPRADD